MKPRKAPPYAALWSFPCFCLHLQLHFLCPCGPATMALPTSDAFGKTLFPTNLRHSAALCVLSATWDEHVGSSAFDLLPSHSGQSLPGILRNSCRNLPRLCSPSHIVNIAMPSPGTKSGVEQDVSNAQPPLQGPARAALHLPLLSQTWIQIGASCSFCARWAHAKWLTQARGEKEGFAGTTTR